MQNTKDVLNYLQNKIVGELEEAIRDINNKGFTPETYATLRSTQNTLSELNAASHFFNAWHPEAKKRA